MINWFYDSYCILNKVYSDKQFIKQAITETPIEEKNRALTVKTCYGVLDKDIELSYYIKYLAEKSPKLAVRTILKISLYAIKYLDKKPYAVIDNAVELTKKLGKGGIGGFVNAFLRKFVSSEIPFPKEKTEYLSIKYSYPEFAVKELLQSYGEQRTVNIISAENKKTCLCFYGINGEEYLRAAGVNFQKTPFENVFYAENFLRNSDYDNGVYTYQALGSVAICEAVEPCCDILDCCSAPGGKSIRLSYKCEKVTAWDIHPHRVELIKDYKSRMGRANVFEECRDAKNYDASYNESFDAVLCDAPCSGLGVVNDNPDIKLNRTYENIEQLVIEQAAILSSVANYVKIDGYLYYSTCSVLDKENIDVVRKFLKRRSDFQMCEIESPLPHENIDGAAAFLPDISDGLGFFVAKMKRNAKEAK